MIKILNDKNYNDECIKFFDWKTDQVIINDAAKRCNLIQEKTRNEAKPRKKNHKKKKMQNWPKMVDKDCLKFRNEYYLSRNTYRKNKTEGNKSLMMINSKTI